MRSDMFNSVLELLGGLERQRDGRTTAGSEFSAEVPDCSGSPHWVRVVETMTDGGYMKGLTSRLYDSEPKQVRADGPEHLESKE